MEMIDSLPKDQAQMILTRLGSEIVNELAEDCKDVSAFYKRCIREMGAMEGNGGVARIPTPGRAWMEVYNQRKLPFEEVSLSHSLIGETIDYFGGWSRMWLDFSRKRFEKSREHWQMKYREFVEGNGR